MERQQEESKELSTRPKRSSSYQKIKLCVNMFPIDMTDSGIQIHIYSLKIEPEIPQDSRELQEQIVRKNNEAWYQIRGQLGKHTYIKGWNIFSQRLVEDPIDVDSTIELSDGQSQTYKITIQYAKKTIDFDEDTEIVDSSTGNIVTQALNIINKNVMKKKMKYLEIDKNSKFYSPHEFNRVNQNIANIGLRVVKGVKLSSYICQNFKPYLQIDFTSRVLRNETVMEYFYKNSNLGDQELRDRIINSSVISNYGNHTLYKITDVDFEKGIFYKFPLQDGSEISLADYYVKQYNIKIAEQDQPLLVSKIEVKTQKKDKKDKQQKIKKVYQKVYLIPELVSFTGMSDNQRSKHGIMQILATETKKSPQQRYQYITEQLDIIAPHLQREHVLIDRNNHEIDAYVLEAPQITVGNKEKINPQSGSFRLKEKPAYEEGKLKDWIFIYHYRDRQMADGILEDFQKVSQQFGIKISQNSLTQIEMDNTDPNQWVDKLEQDINKNGLPSFVLSLSISKAQAIYGKLKEFNFRDQGIPHQHILVDTFNNKRGGRLSIITNIVIQIYCKLAYRPWIVALPEEIREKKQRVMLVGIDIYHKQIYDHKKKEKRTCLGFVASMDRKISKYFSKVIIKQNGEQTVKEIKNLLRKALNNYFEINEYFPDAIVVYRDGITENQLELAKEIEVKEAWRGIQSVSDQENYEPKFAYIFINKKVNLRGFTYEQKRSTGRGGYGAQEREYQNPPSGTIINQDVTYLDKDFFLCAQKVNSGTCTPTHYIIGKNTTNWDELTLHELTYYQCFNYYNWQGAVKVPGVVQLAHKLAYMVGDTFQSKPHTDLSEYLYYL